MKNIYDDMPGLQSKSYRLFRSCILQKAKYDLQPACCDGARGPGLSFREHLQFETKRRTAGLRVWKKQLAITFLWLLKMLERLNHWLIWKLYLDHAYYPLHYP
ncbi:MAG: hypothetical protein U5Q03_01840 [Bacteroidota bacterium]|nr:hypothetical protein [Bacteroidota bacterium]